MKEYIEREAVHSIIEQTSTFSFTRNGMHDKVNSLPAADVAPVVRCKDCRYYQDAKVNEKGFLICQASGMEITEMDYCSYGQRKIETVLPKSDAKNESLEVANETPL